MDKNQILQKKTNYWETNPLKVDNNFKKPIQIISNEELLKKVQNDIDTHQYKLTYKLNDPEMNSKMLCVFINENYIENIETKFKFLYTPDIIQYYIENSLIICFYSLETNNHKSKMIGLIIAKKNKNNC